MNRVYNPVKGKWYTYDTQLDALNSATMVGAVCKVDMVCNANGDYEPKAKPAKTAKKKSR